MSFKYYYLLLFLVILTFNVSAQKTTPNVPGGITDVGTFYLDHVAPSIQSLGVAPEMNLTPQEAGDRRSLRNKVIIGKDRQSQDDYFVRNRHESSQSIRVAAPTIVFDAYQSGSTPSDPSMAIGPNPVLNTTNT